MSITEDLRHHMIVLARRSDSRVSEFSSTRPTKWHPEHVRNPSGQLDDYFTGASAWEFIANVLDSGHPVKTIELEKPRGATGFVMLIHIEDHLPQLYVKLELGSGKIIGRSFHYSNPYNNEI